MFEFRFGQCISYNSITGAPSLEYSRGRGLQSERVELCLSYVSDKIPVKILRWEKKKAGF